MVELTRRRTHGNGDGADKAKSPTGAVGEHEHHDHGLSNTQPHTLSFMGSQRTLTLTFVCSWS
jgi:hypothetical protein